MGTWACYIAARKIAEMIVIQIMIFVPLIHLGFMAGQHLTALVVGAK